MTQALKTLSGNALEVLACLPLDPIVAVLPEIAVDVFGDQQPGNLQWTRDAIQELLDAGWQVLRRRTADPGNEPVGSKHGFCLSRECFGKVKEAYGK